MMQRQTAKRHHMYGTDDPRSKLKAGGSTAAADPYASKATALKYAGAEYVKFFEMPPQQSSNVEKTWYSRGQNFVVAYTEAKAGTVLKRDDQQDEYVVLIPERDVQVTVETQSETHKITTGHSLVIVPPGKSVVTVHSAGKVIRVFSTQSADLNALASNAASYEQAHPNIPPFKPWPNPPSGFKLRVYDLDVPPKEGRFGRLFRCTTLMINVLPLEPTPRDLTKLSPHHHDDFEQGSLALQGSFTHHLRWPWTANIHDWRHDDHEVCPAPSLAVIPPPAIHTSAASDPVMNQLVDIFGPPRMDFSKMAGWVLNADEYPMPE
jgi:hypothetical protein